MGGLMTMLEEVERAIRNKAFDLAPRQSFGEIEGVMLAAGRYRNKEAVQIKNELYGFVWCTLSASLIERFGDEHSMSDVWKGKTIGVQGRLNYVAGGKLQYIDAVDVREIEFAPLVKLEAILDPDFTAGMNPHEYLERLHEGRVSRPDQPGAILNEEQKP
jgi:hypothetical protein